MGRHRSLPDAALVEAAQPVRAIPGDEDRPPEEGTALCLSGGGFRAMLFHLGTLWRLNELGWLPQLDRVSSVSGGSITAGVLAQRWQQLDFRPAGSSSAVATNFERVIAEPILKLAGETIDVSAGLRGIFWRGTIAEKVAAAYARHLFGDASLQALPDVPRFVINATNLQSGVLWRFSKPYMWDYRVGKVESPTERLAVAVAASSAFPPFLSPLKLTLDPAAFTPGSGTDLETVEFRKRPVLTDGGVYDNLGLETAWKRYTRILVSDGGGHFSEEVEIAGDWPRHLLRVLGVIDSQVRALRKRQVIGGFRAGVRRGAYWGVWSEIADYGAPDTLPCPDQATKELARTATRLAKLPAAQRRRIVNWGYAICDAGMRTHVATDAPAPAGFPFPEAGVS